MNMGGGEKYQPSDTSAQVESTNALQNVPPLSEQQETGKTIAESESEKNIGTPAAPGGSESKNLAETKDTIEPPQVPESESVGTSKPEDTTVGETTQQTAEQVAQVTSQQNWEYEQSIKKEEAGKTPLVCLKEKIQGLYQEYEHGSEVYRQKIMVCYLLTHQ
jgi:hypothetical protein